MPTTRSGLASVALGSFGDRTPPAPVPADLIDELRSINAETFDDADDEGIAVRLQLVGGGWTIWWGDPQYDTDHRGFWGDSTVPGNGKKFNPLEVAEELIDRALDHAAT